MFLAKVNKEPGLHLQLASKLQKGYEFFFFPFFLKGFNSILNSGQDLLVSSEWLSLRILRSWRKKGMLKSPQTNSSFLCTLLRPCLDQFIVTCGDRASGFLTLMRSPLDVSILFAAFHCRMMPFLSEPWCWPFPLPKSPSLYPFSDQHNTAIGEFSAIFHVMWVTYWSSVQADWLN